MNPEKQNRLENILQEIASVQKTLFELNTRLTNLSEEVIKLTSEPNVLIYRGPAPDLSTSPGQIVCNHIYEWPSPEYEDHPLRNK